MSYGILIENILYRQRRRTAGASERQLAGRISAHEKPLCSWRGGRHLRRERIHRNGHPPGRQRGHIVSPIRMVTMEENEMTALQWAKKGYIPNADAIGNERWINCHHAQKATYYKASEVHEDADAAREVIKLKRKEYNQASKKREEKREKAIAFRELMKNRMAVASGR